MQCQFLLRIQCIQGQWQSITSLVSQQYTRSNQSHPDYCQFWCVFIFQSFPPFAILLISFLILGLFCSSKCLISGNGLTLATAGLHTMLSVSIFDDYGNYLPSSCQSAAMIFFPPQFFSFVSHPLDCVQHSTTVLSYYATRSGQYRLEVHGLFSELHAMTYFS